MARTYEEKLRDAKQAAIAAVEQDKARRIEQQKAFADRLSGPVRFCFGEDHQGRFDILDDITIVDTTRPLSCGDEFQVICYCEDEDDAELILNALNKTYSKSLP